MIQIREKVELNIWWQLKSGNASFLFDNWTKLGALYYIEGDNIVEEEIEVKEFMSYGGWDRQKLSMVLNDEELVNYIYQDIMPPKIEGVVDKAWWMGHTKGCFTIKSA